MNKESINIEAEKLGLNKGRVNIKLDEGTEVEEGSKWGWEWGCGTDRKQLDLDELGRKV